MASRTAFARIVGSSVLGAVSVLAKYLESAETAATPIAPVANKNDKPNIINLLNIKMSPFLRYYENSDIFIISLLLCLVNNFAPLVVVKNLPRILCRLTGALFVRKKYKIFIDIF
jgi:hypothetical protein